MKIVARNPVALGKLSITIARVRGAAYAAHNPLARIAAQMQHQIPNAVRLFIRPPPDLLIGQPLETLFDLRQKVFDEMMARSRNEFLASVVHKIVFGLSETNIPLLTP